MENLILNHNGVYEVNSERPKASRFLEANTIEMNLNEIRDKHIIPVFLKDNEPAISQVDFVEVVSEAARAHFNLPFTPEPFLRVSHPIKGRIYEARHKKAQELLDNEKTIYYERMAFMLQIPAVTTVIGGNPIELTIGGVKAYNLDNLNTTKGSNEHFKVFAGFKNTVCTNLCISTDGALLDLSVKSLDELYSRVISLLTTYDESSHIDTMNSFNEFQLSENQFAQIIGKARLYQYLPKEEKKDIPELLINDTMISRVAEYYYSDRNFKRQKNGSIDLWRFFNLLTGAVKSSYIDKFLERELNSFEFTRQVQNALETGPEDFWYLN
ncbi:DUF3871 family protein [Algoriphagus kandeliae]|uniref:DUF3871 family protein n=1 Tax=Algoriphagus kandeliae TaxID=2562278 RepID=A0A4Y9QKF1_9BACT|nr:DUF3871 family protein [Algoriphagus kandeliae]TFV93184.1 DUF3871 family protein [Algoriphagus kandeliae]